MPRQEIIVTQKCLGRYPNATNLEFVHKFQGKRPTIRYLDDGWRGKLLSEILEDYFRLKSRTARKVCCIITAKLPELDEDKDGVGLEDIKKEKDSPISTPSNIEEDNNIRTAANKGKNRA